jgi:putative membrane-bound dehydrogenase-like protein
LASGFGFACIVVCASMCVSTTPGNLFAQGYSPAEAPGRMTVPQGLEVHLVASEPMVRQPVAIEFDDLGRLWAIQYLQYPNPAELKRAAVDRYSRTKYDRVPDPPPRGPKGADRITILIDRDGDGRADGSKDFVTGLNLATGLAFGHGGVFVLQVPYLLFYPDRNRDDVPDGDPDVLLSGFGMEDAHSVANSLTWGPDGWLYGCQGSTVTSNIRGIEFQQGVWRYHPITHRFELFCEGGGNSWGLDFDEHGNLFYSTNYGGYAMLHGVQGAYYWKQFGKHGALHNPYAYGYFDHVPHKDLHGGHVTVGGIIYQGDLLPAEFRGKYIAADLLGHAMYWHELSPRDSTFSARHAGDLLLANDTWFAPSDVTIGPDGAIYVCDWHDARTGHPDPDADWDRTNGRIYRIALSQARRPDAPTLTEKPAADLIKLLSSSNDWYVRKARRILADRRDVEQIFPLRALVSAAKDDHLALEAFWTLHVCGGLSEEFATQSLAHRNADVRWWTVRLLGDEQCVSTAHAERFATMAATDPSVAVRSQLASTAKRLPAGQALPIIAALAARDEDANDSYVPMLVWWALERHAIGARDDVVRLFCKRDVRALPMVRATILDRLVRRYAAEGTSSGYLACAKLLEGASPDRGRLFAALDAGLKDRSTTRGGSAGSLFANLAAAEKTDARERAAVKVEVPPELMRQVAEACAAAPDDLTLMRLAARMGHKPARDRAIATLADRRAPVDARGQVAELLAELNDPTSVAPLLQIATPGEPLPLQLAALQGLARFDDSQIPAFLLKAYPRLEPKAKSKTIDVLLGRKSWARALLGAVDRNQVVAADIVVDQLRPVALFHDNELDGIVKKHWGSIREGTPEERLAEMRRINNDLRAATGDPRVGKALFEKHCGTCHRLFGEGNQVGPELTHANRKNLDELLATIVNPSAVIRKEYLSYVVQTLDGRVLTGLIVEQSPSSITLLSAKNERTTVPRDQVESISESATSLMPDDLLNPLKPQELRDLFGYLQSDGEKTTGDTGPGTAKTSTGRP